MVSFKPKTKDSFKLVNNAIVLSNRNLFGKGSRFGVGKFIDLIHVLLGNVFLSFH